MSKQNKWTPEPWKAEDFDERCTFVYGGLFALGAAPLTPAAPVVACCDLHCGGGIEQSRCNGRRIVACVNACTGMSDPDKEIKALREVAEAQIAADDAIDAYEKDDDLDPEVLGAALRRRRQAIDAYRTLAALKAEGEVKNG